MESEWVCDQTRTYLVEPLRHYYRAQRTVAFVGGNSFVYYPPEARCLGPDFYVVRGGRQGGQTKWVSWEEGGLLPTTVVEFLSESTESRDRGEKFCIYRDVFRTEDYFLVDPDTLYVEGFTLQKGHYVALRPEPDGWYWVRSLGLYLGVEDGWIRLRTAQGLILATGRESADAERAKADAERAKADAERAKADAERAKADAERAKADAERARAESAEQELLAAREELRRLRGA